MKKIFEQGEFNNYQVSDLRKSMSVITESFTYAQKKTTVFISHKHDDLNDLKGVIGFLEKDYNVLVYIDSRDPSMPETTSGETAKRIKERIRKCDKFILLATNCAIDSKWCNWELGFGDSLKFNKHIALFPIKPKGEYDYAYKGNEYMSIYPYITYYNGTEKYSDGTLIQPGFYVRTEGEMINTIEPLKRWLDN